MPPRKRARPEGDAAVVASSTAVPELAASQPPFDPPPKASAAAVQPDLSQANGYGLDDEEMGWAAMGKTNWKGKGLSDDIKKVEVSILSPWLDRRGRVVVVAPLA